MHCANFGWNKPWGSEEEKNPVHTDVGGKNDMQTNGHGTTSDKKA